MFITALVNAAAVMIAQTLGAGLFDRAGQVLREAMKLSVAISAVLVLLVELAAPLLARMFTDDPEVIRIAVLSNQNRRASTSHHKGRLLRRQLLL